MRLPQAPQGIYGRLLSATFFLSFVVISGSIAYYRLGDGRWEYFDCVYMTVITLSTVGFAETLTGMSEMPEARGVTLVLIVMGSGTLLYFMSNLTALIVEGDLGGVLRRKSMERMIQRLNGHIILCGLGSTGKHIAAELLATGCEFVVVDSSQSVIDEVAGEFGREFPHVIGDATDDHSLERAGIENASAVIAALTSDKDNLFVTISARALSARCRIVAKCIETTTERKLRRAGANAIVSPNYIGAMRLANEILRPATVAFLDRLMLDRSGHTLRIEEVAIPEDSHVVGRSLAQTKIRDIGVLVIAVHLPDGEYVYNPGKDQLLDEGSGLIVLAKSEDVARLRKGLADGTLA